MKNRLIITILLIVGVATFVLLMFALTNNQSNMGNSQHTQPSDIPTVIPSQINNYREVSFTKKELVSLPDGYTNITYTMEVPINAVIDAKKGQIDTADFNFFISMDPEGQGINMEFYEDLGILNPSLTANHIYRASNLSSNAWIYSNLPPTKNDQQGCPFTKNLDKNKTYYCFPANFALKYGTIISCGIKENTTKALVDCDHIMETLKITY